jgi:hypothetical protein
VENATDGERSREMASRQILTRALAEDRACAGWIGKTWLANYSVTARVPYAADFEISPPPFVPATDTKPLPSPTNQIAFGVSPPYVDDRAEDRDIFALAAASFVRA